MTWPSEAELPGLGPCCPWSLFTGFAPRLTPQEPGVTGDPSTMGHKPALLLFLLLILAQQAQGGVKLPIWHSDTKWRSSWGVHPRCPGVDGLRGVFSTQ